MRWGLVAWLSCAACNSAANDGTGTFQTDIPQLPATFHGTAVFFHEQPGDAVVLVLTNASASAADVCDLSFGARESELANGFVAHVPMPTLPSSGAFLTSIGASFVMLDSSCNAASTGFSNTNTVQFDGSLKGFAKLDFGTAKVDVDFEARVCELADGATTQMACDPLPACTDGGVEPCLNNLP